MVPGFIRREASTVGDKLRIQPHPESIKHIEKVVNRFRRQREEHKKGAEESKEEHAEEEGELPAVVEEVKAEETPV
jgi:hypothetical protein